MGHNVDGVAAAACEYAAHIWPLFDSRQHERDVGNVAAGSANVVCALDGTVNELLQAGDVRAALLAELEK